jgi:hypothetical protein
MDKPRAEFERRFDEVLARTTVYTSEQIAHPVATPYRFTVLMPQVSGRELSRAEAIDLLYLGPDQSFVFIDVAIQLGVSTRAPLGSDRAAIIRVRRPRSGTQPTSGHLRSSAASGVVTTGKKRSESEFQRLSDHVTSSYLVKPPKPRSDRPAD